LVVNLGRPGEDEDVVEICNAEVKSPQNVVHEALERLGKPKDIKGNSNKPNGVVMAVFWMSSGWTDI
jgi:hypothetical protein